MRWHWRQNRMPDKHTETEFDPLTCIRACRMERVSSAAGVMERFARLLPKVAKCSTPSMMRTTRLLPP
eukprot:919038-Pelagomonas_calceolata.AAC.4